MLIRSVNLLYTSIPKFEELSYAEKQLYHHEKSTYDQSARKGLYGALNGGEGEAINGFKLTGSEFLLYLLYVSHAIWALQIGNLILSYIAKERRNLLRRRRIHDSTPGVWIPRYTSKQVITSFMYVHRLY